MGYGNDLLIYERKKEITLEEVNLYKEALIEESKKYPNLYLDVINNYIKENNIK